MRTELILATLTLLLVARCGYSQSAAKGPAQTPLQQELAKFDKNKDGKLDAEEQAAYLADQAKKREEHIKKWDKNGDGKLDEEEAAAARADAKQAFAAARRAQKAAQAAAEKPATPAPPKP